MILRCLSLICLLCLIAACSSSKSRFVYEDLSVDANEGNTAQEQQAPQAKGKAKVDNRKPANFAEYRRWRQANDASGQTYAEYKEWEAAYRQWLKQQNAVSQ